MGQLATQRSRQLLPAHEPRHARASPKRRSESTARHRRTWNGEWTLVIFPRTLGAARDELREELTWLGFGQLTSGVFAHPTHREDTVRARVAELESAGDVIVIQRRRRDARVERAIGRDGLGPGRPGAALSALRGNVCAARRRADSLGQSGWRNSIRAAHAARARISQDPLARSAATRLAAAATVGRHRRARACVAISTRRCSALRKNSCRRGCRRSTVRCRRRRPRCLRASAGCRRP